MATMTCAVFQGDGKLEVVERSMPEVRKATDVRIKVENCGVCGSDLKVLAVPPAHDATVGTIMGHEFAGYVDDIGDGVTSLAVGDRVVVAPNIACEQCAWCLRGLEMQCDRLTIHGIYADGGLAPYAVVSARACHRISPELPRHIAALVEPVSTVVRGVQRAQVFPGETAIVIGGGPIGLMFTALLARAGATVIVVEPTASRAALAEQLGAAAVAAPGSSQLVAAVKRHTSGIGADVVIDAVGSQLGACLEMVRKAGRIVLFGVDNTCITPVRQFDITDRELQIVGAMVGQDTFPIAINLLEQGAFDLGPLVTHRLPLDCLLDALEDLKASRAIKVQVEFS